MRDVAEVAGVSLKTVSRVINDEPGVAPATADRVVGGAIQELGFQRNDLARSLRQGVTSSTLGLVIEDVANPFYSAIAQAVESAARERGFMLITASCEEDPARERELVQALLRRRVDALLLVPASRDHAYLARETADGTPIVFLDRPPSGPGRRLRPARQPRRRPLGHRAPARPRPRADRRRRRPRQPVHRRRAARRLPPGARAPPGCRCATSCCGSDPHDVGQAEAVVRDLLALPARPPPDRHLRRQQPPHDRRPAGAARRRAAHRARRASTTSSWRTCSASPSSAMTARRWAPTPRRWPSSASTAAGASRAASSCRRSWSSAARGRSRHREAAGAPAQRAQALLRGRRPDRRAARPRARLRPHAGGVDRRGEHDVRVRPRAEPVRGRHAGARRDRGRAGGIPRAPSTSRGTGRAPRCSSSCSTPASGCRRTSIPAARSPARRSARSSARPRRG